MCIPILSHQCTVNLSPLTCCTKPVLFTFAHYSRSERNSWIFVQGLQAKFGLRKINPAGMHRYQGDRFVGNAYLIGEKTMELTCTHDLHGSKWTIDMNLVYLSRLLDWVAWNEHVSALFQVVGGISKKVCICIPGFSRLCRVPNSPQRHWKHFLHS